MMEYNPLVHTKANNKLPGNAVVEKASLHKYLRDYQCIPIKSMTERSRLPNTGQRELSAVFFKGVKIAVADNQLAKMCCNLRNTINMVSVFPVLF